MGSAPAMICNSFLFFDRMVEMMIIVCAAPADMNPVDVLHPAEKFEPVRPCRRDNGAAPQNRKEARELNRCALFAHS